jgi:hypothetical protein
MSTGSISKKEIPTPGKGIRKKKRKKKLISLDQKELIINLNIPEVIWNPSIRVLPTAQKFVG